MGKENDMMLEYLRDNRRFADLFNVGLFGGGQVVNEELFALMAHRNNKREMNAFLESHEEYKHIDEETADIISGIMGVETFMENKNRYKEEGSQYNMCQAIREMWEDGLNEGISQAFDI